MAGFRKLMVAVMIMAGLSSLLSGLWIPSKAQLAQYLLQRAWQQSLVTGKIVKPWPWADTWPVGRLQSERLGVDLIVLEGESGEVLAFGPGHLSRSSDPGREGHCVLAGHRDTSFAFLKDLLPGDVLSLEGRGGKETFVVEASAAVRAEELYLDGQQTGLLTLITCFPFQAVNPDTPVRFVVRAVRD